MSRLKRAAFFFFAGMMPSFVLADAVSIDANGGVIPNDATADVTIVARRLAGAAQDGAHPRGMRVLQPLPVGAVKPRGWLFDRSKAAGAGNIGHMDRCGEKFREAWSPDFRMTGDDLYWLGHRGWSYEGGGYWFDGLVRLSLELDDPALLAKAQGKLDGVVTNMSANGLGFLWWLKRDDPELDQIGGSENKWVIGPYGMFGRAVAAWQQARPTLRYRDALVNAFNFNPNILTSGWSAITPQAAVFARELTDDAAVDALLDGYYAKARAGKVRHIMRPVPASWQGLGKWQTVGHVVTELENLTGTLFGYFQTGDRAFLDNVRGWLVKMEEIGLQPNGAFSADECFRPAGAYVGTEVCAISAQQWLLINLLSADGEGKWGDRIEELFFNAGAAVFTRDYTANLVSVIPNRPHPTAVRAGNYRAFAGCGCCTANAARILPIFVQHLWMTTPDGGIAAVLHAPSEVTAPVAGGVKAKLVSKTDYPYGETIEISVSPECAAAFPLLLRLPVWCARPALAVNGQPADYAVERGFARLVRRWQSGDRVSLRLPMAPRAVVATDRTDPNLHFGINKEYSTNEWLGDQNDALKAENVAIHYGPLCFALGIPEKDDTGNSPDEKTAWQYALDPKALETEVKRTPMPPVWNAPFDAPLKMSVAARKATWTHDPKASRLPTAAEVTCGEACRLTLVPYGCAPLRITQFPVAPAD